MKQQKHFVLVHGICHGAWSWYKVKPSLEAAGHRVTAVDLVASGTNTSKLEDVQTLHDYARPLLEVLDKLGPDERVILVGHSMGGYSVALAADIYPRKVSVVAFLASFVPDVTNPPTYVMDMINNMIPPEVWLDTKFGSYETPDRPLKSILLGPEFLSEKTYQNTSIKSILLGPEFLSEKTYQNTSIEDFELAKMLVRPAPVISSSMMGMTSLSEDGYGSVARVSIVCGEDKSAIPPDLRQRWKLEDFPVEEVMEIKDADHMAMLSKPKELCDHLLKLADKYA